LDDIKGNPLELESFTEFLKTHSQDHNLACHTEMEKHNALVQQILWSNSEFQQSVLNVQSLYFSGNRIISIPTNVIEETNEKIKLKDRLVFQEAQKELSQLINDQLSIFAVSKEWTQFQSDNGTTAVEVKPESRDITLTQDEMLFMTDKTPDKSSDRKVEKKSALVEKLKGMHRKSSIGYNSPLSGTVQALISPLQSPLPTILSPDQLCLVRDDKSQFDDITSDNSS
jgi:hypothetical protein